MDYSTGTELFKYQWDFIHNPEGGWFVWEDEEEGASVNFDALNFIQDLRQAALKNEKFNFSRFYKSSSLYPSQLGPVIRHNLKLSNNKTFNICIYLYKVHPDTVNNSIASLSYTKSTYKRKIHYVNSKEYRTYKWKYSKRDVEGVEIAVPEDQADEFERYLFGDNRIIIRIVRTHLENERTVGTIEIDYGVIKGYTLELPRGTNNQCNTDCPDDTPLTSENNCHSIIEGNFNFSVTTSSKNSSHINKSLRLDSEDTSPRSSILIHRGTWAKGWSHGCIIAVPNNPINDTEGNRANSAVQSEDFCIEIVNYVKQRELKIKQQYELTEVEKIIIIQKQ
ncbi:MAG: hypothetical protein PHD06_02920 [Bacteroidales bacterium]|nr:hypothetical protein [Bacteroidales bacterium]MDD4384110.1 hypothetical protein [Bacteroidales bacterium]MDY0197199.1 hypothetical protein [Tenuifilaceae bacterium]